MPLQDLITKIDPRKLFLVDSLGALVSALMLGLVLPGFEGVFGIPQRVLYGLAILACIFFIYSFICFLRKPEHWRAYLRLIAIVNLLYCGLTAGLIIYLYQQLSTLGLTYFIVEIIIIIALAMIEWRTANNTLKYPTS